MKHGFIGVLKSLTAIFLWYSGIALIFHFILNRLYGNPVTILCIHKVIDKKGKMDNLTEIHLAAGHLELGDLELKLRFLKKWFKIISFEEYIAVCNGKKGFSSNFCIITFDDGDIEHYTLVYPLLKELEMPATFFVPTDYVSNSKFKWQDRITALIAGTNVKKFKVETALLSGKDFNIGTINEKVETVGFLNRALKYVSEDIREDFIKELAKLLRLDNDLRTLVYPKTMEWGQLRTIADNPLMSIGAHTHTHSVLTKLSEQEVRCEIEGAKQKLEENLGRPVTLFSYPFGKSGDFNEEIKGIAESAGFQVACSFCYGRNNKESDRFALKRIPLLSEYLCVFKTRMSGIFDFISTRREEEKDDYLAVNTY